MKFFLVILLHLGYAALVAAQGFVVTQAGQGRQEQQLTITSADWPASKEKALKERGGRLYVWVDYACKSSEVQVTDGVHAKAPAEWRGPKVSGVAVCEVREDGLAYMVGFVSADRVCAVNLLAVRPQQAASVPMSSPAMLQRHAGGACVG